MEILCCAWGAAWARGSFDCVRLVRLTSLRMTELFWGITSLRMTGVFTRFAVTLTSAASRLRRGSGDCLCVR